ncbi:MAG: NAD-dependent epimerase/dehydratase family protein, partial [Candidatus Heimdallarchaeota archaeon]|nr:NAD-dependent epimerase/dehydratase family protein [Candidatus Heimdallarchaeota archaeon]
LFGERQHPEKFIPLCIRKILAGEKITIHGSADKTQSGSRFYIHARNVADIVHFLLENFEQRDKYNIVGEKELTNLQLAQKIADILGKPLNYEIVDFHSSRPGHDLRYALDGTKLKEMGYDIPVTIDKSLKKTVEWTLKHDKWLYI